MANNLALNEGMLPIEDFVCDAIPEPELSMMPGDMRETGVRISGNHYVFDAVVDDTGNADMAWDQPRERRPDCG